MRFSAIKLSFIPGAGRKGSGMIRIGGFRGGNVRDLSDFKDLRNLRSLRCMSSFHRRKNLARQDSELVRMSSIELVPSIADKPEQIIDSLQDLQGVIARERVPWFLEAMPSSYFRQVSREMRLKHLVSVVSIQDMQHIPEIISYEYFEGSDSEVQSMSFIDSGENVVGKLEKQLEKVPNEARFSVINLYTSKDGILSISDFIFKGSEEVIEAEPESLTVLPTELLKYTKRLLNNDFETDRKQFLNNNHEVLHAKPAGYFNEKELAMFMKLGPEGFDSRVSPRRLCKFVEMYHQLLQKGTDEVLIDVESNWGGFQEKTMFTLALTNVLVKPGLQRICKYLESKGMMIERVHLDKVKSNVQSSASSAIPEYNDVAFLRLLITPMEKDELEFDAKKIEDMKYELTESLPKIAKWLDDRVINACTNEELRNFTSNHNFYPSAIDFEILFGFLDLVHITKANVYEDLYEFSKTNIESVLFRPQTYEIVQLFRNYFERGTILSRDDLLKKCDEIKASYSKFVEIPMEVKVLDKMIDIVKATEKTNLKNKDRFAMALRVNPKVCMNEKDLGRVQVPFSVLYVSGRNLCGVHTRFKKIARGGLRLLTPSSTNLANLQMTQLFNECYDLAYAQQLKNKDIAEGGSKAVCLVSLKPEHIRQPWFKEHVVRKSMKAFVNSILDILLDQDVPDADQSKEVDHIYLGPDENVSIEHINWIVERAAQRKYSMPTAFMSSKPKTGINHKEWGVTSEGVQVFLDSGLKLLQQLGHFDGKHLAENNPLKRDLCGKFSLPFTVTITGGPDGDVAGNMLKVLHREYGSQCKVLGIADGTGCLENVDEGVAWPELLRLVKESLPLNKVNLASLAANTKFYTLERAEGVQRRNTMHNRISADAFIPCGGRPGTISESNFLQFIDPSTTKPRAKLIVEGANLFLTGPARKQLAKHGCIIIKDSSANKCGVICSSFEIMSSMLLSQEEFVLKKSTLVPEVLGRLRVIAKREADLLMTEYRKHRHDPNFNLVETSMQISALINQTKDAVRQFLVKNNVDSAMYWPQVKDFLPPSLTKGSDMLSAFQKRVPQEYILNLISTVISSDLVYNEGVDFVKNIKDDDMVAEVASKYSQEKRNIALLVERLVNMKNLTPKEIETVAKLLQIGGARTSVNTPLLF